MTHCHVTRPVAKLLWQQQIIRRFVHSTMYNILADFEKDQPDPVQCIVKGTVPPWLKGKLLRAGPGLYKMGDDTYRHWFDGQGVIHKYSFDGGNIQYQNRLLPTASLQKNLQANRIVVSEFGTASYPDPCKSIFTRYFSYFFGHEMGTRNNNVNILPFGDRLFAMTETSILVEVDKDNLDVKGEEDISKYVTAFLSTAHPHGDRDGTIYNMGLVFGKDGKYTIIKIPPVPEGENPLEKASLLGTIPAARIGMNSYTHSFGMSENFVIYMEHPLVFNGFKIMARKLRGLSIQECIEWKEGKTLIHVMNKSTGELLPFKITTEPLFTFHHINAYEEDDHLVVDLCAYCDGRVMGMLVVENFKKGTLFPMATVKRYVIPLKPEMEGKENLVTLKNTTATAEKQEDGSIHCVPHEYPGSEMELPRINYRQCNGRKYRYVYGFHSENSLNWWNLSKLDVETGEVTMWKGEDGLIAGEPVFVANPEGKEEDEGVLLSPVIPTDTSKSAFMLVLDAQSMKELGRAEVPPEVQVPLTFHGNYFTKL